MKKLIAITLAGAVGITGLVLTNFIQDDRPVLKIASCAEYIAGGDENSYLLREFEEWYEEQTGKRIRVEYCTYDENETLYNMLKMGDHFDLVTSSEYMFMKLYSEGRIQKLPDWFFDTSNPENYYINNLSPFIKQTFENNTIADTAWKEFAAGYMWGTTGFVYNPEYVNENDVKSWNVFTNTAYAKQITAKNNIRDSYFTGLAMHYDTQLREYKAQYERGDLSYLEYQNLLKRLMNDTSPDTMNSVKDKLMSMTKNLYGFETDEGKNDVVAGKIQINYQWSGDAVYIMDSAEYGDEQEDNKNFEPLILNYAIPETVSNLWFDGWTLTKDCNDTEAAAMFINFISKPENAVANMEYIGFTSCIGSEEVFTDFVRSNYEAEEDDEESVLYDLNYYFNPSYDKNDPSTRDEKYIFKTPKDQIKRQLFAQYPDEETLAHCVAMEYFNADANSRANSMWSDITFF